MLDLRCLFCNGKFVIFYFHYKWNKQTTFIICGQGIKGALCVEKKQSPKCENRVLMTLKSVCKASIESTDFSFFNETYSLSIMKARQPADISTTELLLSLGSQVIFGRIEESQYLKRKLSMERGSSLMNVLTHGF